MRTANLWAGGKQYTIYLQLADVYYLRDHRNQPEVFHWLRRVEPDMLKDVWIEQLDSVWVQDGFQFFCVWGPTPV